jgi:hypothetical protein
VAENYPDTSRGQDWVLLLALDVGLDVQENRGKRRQCPDDTWVGIRNAMYTYNETLWV